MKDILIFTQIRYNLIIVRLIEDKTCCWPAGEYLNEPSNKVNNAWVRERGEREEGE